MKSTAEVVKEVFDANWGKTGTKGIMALAVEMDRAQRDEPVARRLDYAAKAEKSLRAATQIETLEERRMLRVAEAQVYATLALAEAGRAEHRSNFQAALERARIAVADYEIDTSGKPWQYNPMHDDGAKVAIALRDLVKALES